MYYFQITDKTVDFATEINDGVRPTILDEEGDAQFYIVNLKNQPNEIISRGDFQDMRDLVMNGTRIIFVEGIEARNVLEDPDRPGQG